ncbi:MAG: hypothetical protein WD066_00605 [Planctomycetaceae bacterium]
MPNHFERWLMCLCGWVAVAAAGCQSPYSYDYYGSPSYGMPAGGGYPGGTYMPAPAMGAPPALGAPMTAPGPTMTYPQGGPTYPVPAGGGDAPPFDPQRDSGSPSGGNLVPYPLEPGGPRDARGNRDGRGTRDPGDLQPPPGARRPPQPPDDLHSPFDGAAAREDATSEPLARLDAAPEPALGGATVSEEALFEPPLMNPGSGGRRRIEARPVSDAAVAGDAIAGTDAPATRDGRTGRNDLFGREPIDRRAAGDELNPFGHDEIGYTWLKGQIDYDNLTDTWHIIYSVKGEDEFGGAMLLSTIPDGVELEDSSIVFVQGSIDRTRPDENGKATYRADSINRLRPSPQAARESLRN